ncbi:serine protease [Bacteroides sp.]|uniref:S1 family peptidase n=1 Tax=Bacteroides sp. TaxID=29523 RepID=UPI00262E9E87|nr:serine protease [Bacteroides sp.]MDD3041025.1 serine protease [Bacteroides sp.]
MLVEVAKRFAGGCVMVYRKTGEDSAAFLGTGFLVDEKGYILTCAHILNPTDDLVIAKATTENGYAKIDLDGRFQASAVRLHQYDPCSDIALLKFVTQHVVSVAQILFGSADEVSIGTSVGYLGYPFGDRLCVVSSMSAVVSAKIIDSNGVKMIQIDNMCHEGNSGGPLINLRTGLIIGIISGRLNPFQAAPSVFVGNRPVGVETNIGYAAAIEHALPLLESEGLDSKYGK